MTHPLAPNAISRACAAPLVSETDMGATHIADEA